MLILITSALQMRMDKGSAELVRLRMGGGSLTEYTSKIFKLLRLQPLTLLNPPPLQEEECKVLKFNNVQHSPS